MIIHGQFGFNCPSGYVFCSDMKFKMAATAGLSLTLDSGKNVSKCFFSETTWTIETKLP
jgi:hypothetical protein